MPEEFKKTADAKDKLKKARDSAYFAESMQQVIAAAEILSPGISLPTYDRAAAPKKTMDAICALRRRALDRAAVAGSAAMIQGLNGGKTLDTANMSCAAVRVLFNSAVYAMKQANGHSTHDGAAVGGAAGSFGNGMGRTAFKSIKELNEANRKAFNNAA
jgi:hypothetical protein